KSATKPSSPRAATNPPQSAPRPTPRLAATRETAVERWRISGRESDASSADWLGCSAAPPAPAGAAAAKAGAGACPQAGAGVRAGGGGGAERGARRRGERGGHDRHAGHDADDQARDAEAEAAPVVEVDHLEGQHGAPAEVVEEDPGLDDPELPGQAVGE